MNDGYMHETGERNKLGEIAERRALTERQTDLERDHLGATKQSPPGSRVAGVDAERVRATVQRIEELERERAMLADDIKDALADAKKANLDVKVIRELVRERKKKPGEAGRQLDLLDVYRRCMEAGE